jgi:sirohydrochlorin ferrochelatase
MAHRALVLLDHGSRRSQADRYLQALASELRTRREDLAVHVAHLEIAAPGLADVLAECAAAGVQHVAVYPFFLAPGNHLEQDVPEQIARARAAHPQLRIELLAPLGASSELAGLVLRGYDASARDVPSGPQLDEDAGKPAHKRPPHKLGGRSGRGTPL